MVEDALLKNKIKSLILKGFTKEEIIKLLGIKETEFVANLETVSSDISINSAEYYSELQKDLSKLVMTELNNDKTRDSNVILNAIKLQAHLQEKKLFLGKRTGESKVSKDYVYERDKEVQELKKKGMSDEKIAKELDMHILSVKQAIDRNELDVSEEFKQKLSPSVISETKGLSKKRRLEILQQAVDENLKRNQVRKMVVDIKNEER